MKYKDKLLNVVVGLAEEAGLKRFLSGGFVDKQKTGVRVKLDFVIVTDDLAESFGRWCKLVEEKFGGLVVKCQLDKEHFTHDSAGRYLGGTVCTNVRVRFSTDIIEEMSKK